MNLHPAAGGAHRFHSPGRSNIPTDEFHELPATLRFFAGGDKKRARLRLRIARPAGCRGARERRRDHRRGEHRARAHVPQIVGRGRVLRRRQCVLDFFASWTFEKGTGAASAGSPRSASFGSMGLTPWARPTWCGSTSASDRIYERARGSRRCSSPRAQPPAAPLAPSPEVGRVGARRHPPARPSPRPVRAWHRDRRPPRRLDRRPPHHTTPRR